jgi:hypothetical protein
MEKTKYRNVYLTIKGQNELSKNQFIAFCQILRIVESLRFHMSLMILIDGETEEIYRLRNQFEIYASIASKYKEAIKEIFNNQYAEIIKLIRNESLIHEWKKYKKKIDNYKSDIVQKIFDELRNVYSFHMRDVLFRPYVNDNKATEKQLIITSRSNMIIDTIYLPGYDAVFNVLGDITKDIVEPKKMINFVFKHTRDEVDILCKLCEKTIKDIMKGRTETSYS